MIQKQGNWVPYELNRETLKGDFSCEQLIQRQQRKGFSDYDWRSGYSGRQSQEEKIFTLSPVKKYYAKPVAINLNINTTAKHSWFEDHALYLVEPKGSCLL